MRIAIWNVQRPSTKRDDVSGPIVSHLLGLEADIVVLTETHSSIDLGSEFSTHTTTWTPRKPEEGESVAAICVRNSKFAFIRKVDTSDPREAVCVELDSKIGRILIYGSIIVWDGYKGESGTSKRWEEHKRAIKWHQCDWARLRKDYPGHHVIAAGDYNQNRDGAKWYGTVEVRQLLTQALENTGLTCVTEEDFTTSRNLSRHSIDHVCLTSGLAKNVVEVNVWEGTIDGKALSDHNGILVDIDTQRIQKAD